MSCFAFAIDFNIKHLLRNDSTLTRAGNGSILHGMFDEEKHSRFGPWVPIINKNRSATWKVSVPFKDKIEC